MTLKTISAFQTEDGTIFTRLQDAERHEARLDFADWYSRNELYSFMGHEVPFDHLVEWLTTNRSELETFLKSR